MYNGFLVPNNLLIEVNKSQSWLSNMDNKAGIIMCYLFNAQRRTNNLCSFTLEDMIIWCGFSPHRSKGRTNDKFKFILNNLNQLKAIKSNIDLLNVKPNEYITVEYNAISYYENRYYGYSYCSVDSFDKIIKLDLPAIEKCNLLNVYLYISARVSYRTKGDAIEISGGKSESCWFSYETIAKELNISLRSISTYISTLKNMDLIDYSNVGKLINSKSVVINGANVYVLCSTNDYKLHLKEGLKESLYYFNSIGYEKYN